MAMEDIVKNDEIPRIANSAADKGKWLALKEASAFLGVHFTTLRSWADRGDIPVFRTPGGHRRFSIDDLRRFLAERAGSYPSSDPNALVKTAVERVRVELRRVQPVPQRWQYPLDPATDQARRERGRTLFALAISFVMKPQQRSQLLESGRQLGWEYGHEAAHSGVMLAETGRAVQFFRSQLVDTVRNSEAERIDADDLRIKRLIDLFLDEVLYAVLDGYEAALGGVRSS